MGCGKQGRYQSPDFTIAMSVGSTNGTSFVQTTKEINRAYSKAINLTSIHKSRHMTEQVLDVEATNPEKNPRDIV